MRRKRRLRPEELELWGEVAKTAIPMVKPRVGVAPRTPPPTPEPERQSGGEIRSFRIGQGARGAPPSHKVTPSISEALAAQRVAMDKKAFTRLKRGKLQPEARLDLHGMTLEHAHPALVGFIQRAAAQDLRLVLVITGKGKPGRDDMPMPERRGVLRHQVPQWLRMGPLAPLVLQISEAHLRHGGGGAYYVYLRRRR